MSYAIVEISGRQFWVEPDRFYDLNYACLSPGDKISLFRVLLKTFAGGLMIGQPCVQNAVVEATVLGHLIGRKMTVYKMKPKKKTRKKQGHRTYLTRILIESIL